MRLQKDSLFRKNSSNLSVSFFKSSRFCPIMKVVSCAWKMVSFSPLSSALMLRFPWSVVMVLDTFCFMAQKLQRKMTVVWSTVAFLRQLPQVMFLLMLTWVTLPVIFWSSCLIGAGATFCNGSISSAIVSLVEVRNLTLLKKRV